MERKKSAVSKPNNGIVQIKKNIKRIDILGNLPPEIAQKILMLSDPLHLVSNVWNCCKVWRSIMNNNYFWKMKCLTDDFCYVPSQNSKNYQKIMQKSIPWEGIYKYNASLNYNMRNNIYTQINVQNLVDSTEKLIVGEIYHFDDDLLVLRILKQSQFITIIDISVGVLKQLLSVRRGFYVYLVNRVEDFMIIVLNSKTQRMGDVTFCYIWNIKCGIYIVKHWKMRSNPQVISYYKCFLIVYDYLGFYIFNTDTNSIVFDYDGSQRHICAYLHHHKNMAIYRCNKSESDKDTIITYNMENKTLKKIICCSGVKCSLLSEGKYSILFCNNGHASTWNLETMKKLNLFRFNSTQFDSNHILINANVFISKSYNLYSKSWELQVWNFISGTCINRIKFYSTSGKIMSNNRYIFIDEDEFINVYCPRTGKALLSISCGQDPYCVLKVSETKILIGRAILYSHCLTDLIVLNYDNKIKI